MDHDTLVCVLQFVGLAQLLVQLLLARYRFMYRWRIENVERAISIGSGPIPIEFSRVELPAPPERAASARRPAPESPLDGPRRAAAGRAAR